MSLEIIKRYKINAKKSLGQNFLIDDFILDEIASWVEVFWKNIVEVWPGYWALTEKLLNKKPKSLNLVELDKDMIGILEDRIKKWELDISWKDFKINNVDVLKYTPTPPAPLPKGEGNYEYSIIANIPYYITSPILRHFLYDIEFKPKNMVILMQKDVADKILSNKTSVLSLFVSKKCKVYEFVIVPNTSFVPAPKVESSVLIFETHDNYKYIDDKKFLDLIKIWFKEPRKKLINNLLKWWYSKEKVLRVFKELWISENVRGEELWIEEWIGLIKLL